MISLIKFLLGVIGFGHQDTELQCATNLSYIGAGLSRTGTQTLKQYFSSFDVNVYNIETAMTHDDKHFDYFNDELSVLPLNHNCRMTLDIPLNFYYRELHNVYPNATIIVSYRDADSWVHSFEQVCKTFYPLLSFPFFIDFEFAIDMYSKLNCSFKKKLLSIELLNRTACLHGYEMYYEEVFEYIKQNDVTSIVYETNNLPNMTFKNSSFQLYMIWLNIVIVQQLAYSLILFLSIFVMEWLVH